MNDPKRKTCPREEKSRFDSGRLAESDLASDTMGRNGLQGNDQENVRNERHSLPEEKAETDGVLESFEKSGKEERAERDSERKKKP